MTRMPADAVPRAVADEVVDHVVARTMQICAVPGPPLREADRGDLVERWWRRDELDPVTRDARGNVWARVRAGDDPTAPAVVVCAHLDTVFEPHEPHGARLDGDVLRGPSVGDDSVALAALATLDTTLPARLARPVWLLATVGEEGLGDLAGVRSALADPVVPVDALVAVEGNYLGRVCTIGVGSARWRVEVTAPGGHAWEASEVPSAVHLAARMVDDLVTAVGRVEGRTALNVGTFAGGEAINGRGRHARFEVDLRADDPDVLAAAVAEAERVVTGLRPDEVAAGCSVTVAPIGSRPAGRVDEAHPLVRAAVEAQEVRGITPRFTAASTDANAAHAAGVPALAVGVTVGEGEHTLDEWISLPPLAEGLAALADTVVRYQDHRERGASR